MGMHDLHPSWQRAVEATDRVRKALGGSIYDWETGKTWDQGQAVCREMLGPGWNDDPRFAAISAAEICPDEYFQAVERLVNEDPDWLRPSPEDEEATPSKESL